MLNAEQSMTFLIVGKQRSTIRKTHSSEKSAQTDDEM